MGSDDDGKMPFGGKGYGGDAILKRVSSEQKKGITSSFDIPIYGASHLAW